MCATDRHWHGGLVGVGLPSRLRVTCFNTLFFSPHLNVGTKKNLNVSHAFSPHRRVYIHNWLRFSLDENYFFEWFKARGQYRTDIILTTHNTGMWFLTGDATHYPRRMVKSIYTLSNCMFRHYATLTARSLLQPRATISPYWISSYNIPTCIVRPRQPPRIKLLSTSSTSEQCRSWSWR